MGFLHLSTEVQNIPTLVGFPFALGRRNTQENLRILIKSVMCLCGTQCFLCDTTK